jgi:hypothetical protein
VVEPELSGRADRPTEGKVESVGDSLSPVPNSPTASPSGSPSRRVPKGSAGGGGFSCSERFQPKFLDPILSPLRLIDPDRDFSLVGPGDAGVPATVPPGDRAAWSCSTYSAGREWWGIELSVSTYSAGREWWGIELSVRSGLGGRFGRRGARPGRSGGEGTRIRVSVSGDIGDEGPTVCARK